MKFGYFDDANKEYVIQNPKTPYPWINYLGTQEFFSLISNTAGGYHFYKDARLRRITRYRYNNVPVDMGGRYFYIKDGETVWSPGWSPVKTDLDAYTCRHGMGYTVISGKKNDISAEVTFFVPQNYNGEIQSLVLKNEGSEAKTIKLFSFIEWCLWNAQDDSTNFQRNFNTGEVEIEGSTIFHKTEYKERRNHFAFYTVNDAIDGYDTDRESFLGLYNGFENPQVVAAGKASNSVADGWSPVASHYKEITLAPGESKQLIFILGYVENPKDQKWNADGSMNKSRAYEMIEQYNTPEKVAAALAELKAMWDALLSKYSVKTPDDKMNRMVNIWNQYQCMVTFNMSRSASYFESGIGRGMGFRDSNQDLLGFVHQIPDRARERLIDLASTQLEDGGCYHQYQPLTKKGNNEIGGDFSDDPLWMILSVAAYIKESGDYSILDAMVPYDNDESKAKTMMDHAEGVGLAAPQIGLPIRVVVVDLDVLSEDYPEYKNFRKAYINPHILEVSGEEISMEEGCLSLPGIHESVKRGNRIHVTYMDEDMVEHDEVVEGYLARVMQHEFDHLEGKMFIDHLSPLRKQMIKGKLNAMLKGKAHCTYKVKTVK